MSRRFWPHRKFKTFRSLDISSSSVTGRNSNKRHNAKTDRKKTQSKKAIVFKNNTHNVLSEERERKKNTAPNRETKRSEKKYTTDIHLKRNIIYIVWAIYIKKQLFDSYYRRRYRSFIRSFINMLVKLLFLF